MIWFTSDTHFGSERTLQLHKRPFKTVAQMDEVIIDGWNEVVSPYDTVYHLGDFGDYTVRDQLNGRIVLIKGNYDADDRFKEIFNGVYNNYYFKLPDGSLIYMNHYPSKHNPNMFNLFGHVHKLCMIKRYGLNVGVDCHNWTPIDLETVLFYKTAIDNFYDSEVFD